MLCPSVIRLRSLFWHTNLSILPRVLLPWPWAADCTSPSLFFRLGIFFKKWKERESRAQRMHKTVVTFVFKKKRKNLKVFLFSSALAFMKTDKGQICYFPSEKAKGALIFSLPIPEWIIIVRLLWVTMCSVARFTFKWNQMAVHSEMIYSNDHGNKSKVLFHIGPAPTRDHCHLGTLQVQSVSYVFAMSRLLPSHFNEWIHQHAA